MTLRSRKPQVAAAIADMNSIIHRWRTTGTTLRDMAREYGVSRSTLGRYARMLVGRSERRRLKREKITASNRRRGWLPIGTIVCHSGRRYVKIRDVLGAGGANWQCLSIANWERAHGPIPRGWCLRFLDGDRLHDDLENLALQPNQTKWLRYRAAHPEAEQRRIAKLVAARRQRAQIERGKRDVMPAINAEKIPPICEPAKVPRTSKRDRVAGVARANIARFLESLLESA